MARSMVGSPCGGVTWISDSGAGKTPQRDKPKGLRPAGNIGGLTHHGRNPARTRHWILKAQAG